jgi:hypothetical protein
MTPDNKIKVLKYLYIFSPCFIGVLFSAVATVISLLSVNYSGGWSIIGIILFLPATIILLVADRLVKFTVKDTRKLWIIQVIVLIVLSLLLLLFKYYPVIK